MKASNNPPEKPAPWLEQFNIGGKEWEQMSLTEQQICVHATNYWVENNQKELPFWKETWGAIEAVLADAMGVVVTTHNVQKRALADHIVTYLPRIRLSLLKYNYASFQTYTDKYIDYPKPAFSLEGLQHIALWLNRQLHKNDDKKQE